MPASREEILIAIRIHAKQIKINESVLLAIAVTESNLNPCQQRYEPNYPWLYEVNSLARNMGCSVATMRAMQSTSYGLMQIMASTAYDLGFRGWAGELFDVDINLHWSTLYLKRLIDKYSLTDPLDIYAAYNAGSVRKVDGRYVNAHNVNRFKGILKMILPSGVVVSYSGA